MRQKGSSILLYGGCQCSGEGSAARYLDALQVEPVSNLVDGWQRPEGTDLTLFKAMGMGVSDLALGIELLKQARAQGRGRAIDAPERAAVRLVA